MESNMDRATRQLPSNISSRLRSHHRPANTKEYNLRYAKSLIEPSARISKRKRVTTPNRIKVANPTRYLTRSLSQKLTEKQLHCAISSTDTGTNSFDVSYTRSFSNSDDTSTSSIQSIATSSHLTPHTATTRASLSKKVFLSSRSRNKLPRCKAATINTPCSTDSSNPRTVCHLTPIAHRLRRHATSPCLSNASCSNLHDIFQKPMAPPYYVSAGLGLRRRRHVVSSKTVATSSSAIVSFPPPLEDNKENSLHHLTPPSAFKTPNILSPRRISLNNSLRPSSMSPSQVSLENYSSNISQLSRKTSEKLQTERMKKLKSRWVEQDLDTATDDASQISALSPSICSLLNLTEQDSKERLMDLLKQNKVKAWSEVFHKDDLINLTKIGEGVYGEVFQMGGPNGDVIKMFPIEGEMSIMDGSRSQMTFHSVFPEVYVSKRLSELARKSRKNRTTGFSQLKSATLVMGKLPEDFVIQWRTYDTFYKSENICLDYLPENQLWIILQYEYAGTPLEKYKFSSSLETRSVFEQISLSLAAAEAELQFEHRDLHWANVLVLPIRYDKLRFRVNGENYSIMTYGVRATIIDFTVSRLAFGGNTVYVDMSENPDIFNVYDGEYQNEIYRMMRHLNGNEWRSFHARTNLMWLHYLCDKFLNEVRVTRADPNFEAVHSELLALEETLNRSAHSTKTIVENDTSSDNVVIGCGKSRLGSKPLRHSKRYNIGDAHGVDLSLREPIKPLYSSAAEFVAYNFYFDSCRISSGSALP